MLATYRFRVGHNGIQMLIGRCGTEAWLVMLGRLASWQGRGSALEEIHTVVTLLGGHSDPEYSRDGAIERECEWLELHGRQAIRAALGELVAGGEV